MKTDRGCRSRCFLKIAPALTTRAQRLSNRGLAAFCKTVAESGLMQDNFRRFWGNLPPGPRGLEPVPGTLPALPPQVCHSNCPCSLLLEPRAWRESQNRPEKSVLGGKTDFFSKPRVQRPRNEASGTRARSSRPQHREICLPGPQNKRFVFSAQGCSGRHRGGAGPARQR